jgi:dienelactone hydrolase
VPETCPNTGVNGDNPPCFAWQGRWVEQVVTVPSHADPTMTYAGMLFAPENLSDHTRLPAVVLMHGLSGKQQNLWWAARALTGHGYLSITAQDPSNSADSFLDVTESMADFLLSAANPLRDHVDADELGVAGHSAGARAASIEQDLDTRFRAAVAYDNLTTDRAGDSGTYLLAPECVTGTPLTGTGPVTPRVPALGFASDTRAVTCPEDGDPDIKKPAWSLWRAHGLPTVEVVLRAASHFSFSQSISSNATEDPKYLAVSWTLTQAWFDHYLTGDRRALRLLNDPSWLGAPRSSWLSTSYRSASYLPELRVDCPDLAACPTRTPG